MSIKHEFLSLMNSGGPVMCLIFIVACIAMVLLVWEAVRNLRLMKGARCDYNHLRLESDYFPGNIGDVNPVAQLYQAVNWSTVETKEDTVRELNIHLREITPRIEGSLTTIAILASLLPMLGLLGTVTGMINVFDVIALQGSGNPSAMADGISQALLTTASGLIIAIPVIFLHHLMSQRVKALMVITQQAAQLMMHRDINVLKKGYAHVGR